MEAESLEGEITRRSNLHGDSTIRGMGSVVATVSGYHGSERFKLIKLINQTGANYVGTMTRSTTHLVCWKFEGRKYDMARSFGTLIVSHSWFEDCLKEGKRLPERPYIMQCGQKVGPLMWKAPVFAGKETLFTSKRGKAFKDLTNVCEDTDELVEMAWTNSHLLTQKLLPRLEERKGSSLVTQKSKGQKTSKQYRSGTEDCSFEPLLSGMVGMQQESSPHPSLFSKRHKTNVVSAVESTSAAGTTRKSRRLVKKNASGGIVETADLNFEKEFYLTETSYNINHASNDSNALRNENSLAAQEANNKREHGNGELENLEDISELNDMDVSNSLDRVRELVLPTQERTSENVCPDIEKNLNEEFEDVLSGETGELPTSTDLSCVICWTDFSSTRGVLPCGHRFCYSCIQSWADHMVSRRKVSTCPLCKATFVSITKVDDAASSDQKIYSQTIPYASGATDVFLYPDREMSNFGAQPLVVSVCFKCRFREPEDLLITCHLCQSRCVHSYCLDPPLVPWTCDHCRGLGMLYHSIR
ncbi:PREDICTED: uncharacterized protein LOC104600707 [Nelumbo nucifera]|uniref:Uncharacterized protein LOC104600707 n=2 Tax=Nelumbo nucifera TaxID=4432 RepID=A0A1U8A4N2_NELNU|nr:PREDICTED: uncharacterized protein LOC104600707 [Nelumbo nucifera]DAD35187.1 TPA_asm: hypothetical protein HUJ06_005827 [Nelumbo nucifera]